MASTYFLDTCHLCSWFSVSYYSFSTACCATVNGCW